MQDNVVVALDMPTKKMISFVARCGLKPTNCFLKLHYPITGFAEVYGILVDAGFRIFIDLKSAHPVDATYVIIKGVCDEYRPWVVSIRIENKRTLESGIRAVEDSNAQARNGHQTILTGVTLPTQTSQEELEEIGIFCSPESYVCRLVKIAVEAGFSSVVCSADEVASVRKIVGPDRTIFTPGIRPEGFEPAKEDQRRMKSPAEAVISGADYLVVGKPVTHPNIGWSATPAEAFKLIRSQVTEAWQC